jgi:N-glycosylase/DNA lyase
MERGAIDVDTLSGPFDLQATIESGQSYLWEREDGQMYADAPPRGGDAWYARVVRSEATGEPAVVRVRQRDGRLEWEGQTDAEPLLREYLRLDDDLPAIFDAIPDDPLLNAATDSFPGLRIVCDPAFGTLISFICSAQMRVERIQNLQRAIAREFGTAVEFDGRTYHAFPTPGQLATATEDQLRDLGIGYRAPYVRDTAQMVADGEAHPDEAAGLPFEDAREYLTQFVGVGDKIADCVAMFGLGYLEAVPLDTWMRTTIEDYYPDCAKGSYADTSRAIREQFGGSYAGYAQTYVYHYLRNTAEPVAGPIP